VRWTPGKGANRVLFFGAENGIVQMAKNKPGCLFRPLFFGSFLLGPKEMNINQKKRGCPFETPSFLFLLIILDGFKILS
jgi:hypothetical protein